MSILYLHISRGPLLDSEGVERWVFGYYHDWDKVYMDMVGWSIWN